MPYQQTSREAYQAILASGVLRQRQQAIVTFFYRNQDRADLQQMISQKDVEQQADDRTRSLGPRFRELEVMGVIYCVGTKVGDTGRRVNGYRLTGNVPVVAAKPISPKQKLAYATSELDQIIARVKQESFRDRLQRLRDYLNR